MSTENQRIILREAQPYIPPTEEERDAWKEDPHVLSVRGQTPEVLMAGPGESVETSKSVSKSVEGLLWDPGANDEDEDEDDDDDE